MFRHLSCIFAAALFSTTIAGGQKAFAVPIFTQTIGDVGPGANTITFQEFNFLDDVGGGVTTPVPGHTVTLESSRLFRVFDLGTPPTTPPTVPGFFEGQVLAQPTGSISAGSFFINFASDVSAAGLVLANNFGSTERFYNARAFDGVGGLLAEELNIAVIAAAEFIGFTSTIAEIARIELSFGPTFGTGQRPIIDTITYQTSALTPVPLPATIPLMAVGLGLLGLFGRQRKSDAAT